MSSKRPSDKPKHGIRHTIRHSIQRAKGALISKPTPLSPSGQSQPSATSSSGSQIDSRPQFATGSLAASTTTPNENAAGGPLHEGSESTWDRLSKSLGILERSLELFPPLKSAVGALAGCLEIVKVAASNRADYEELADEFQSMANTLGGYASKLESEKGNGSVANIVQCIQSHIADIKQYKEQGSIQRLRGATNDQEDVIKRYRQIERLFRQLQCDITMRAQDQVKKQLEITLLRGMLPVDDARYNSSYSMTIKRGGCTPETRQRVQQTLQEWAVDPTSSKIYWMNGMAGTGKTTIAYSFCEWLEQTNRLGASFFCSRISATCRSLNRVVPTLAYQLARYSPAFCSTLCAALNSNPDAASLNVGQQFEKLVYHPMIEAKTAIPDGVVIVVDALDECDDAFSVRLLLDVLLNSTNDLPLKFFVLSRPEYVIRDRMMSKDGTTRSIMHLHDIEESIVKEDIKKYLTEALGSMSNPPSLEQIETLAQRAGTLFIYAATVVRYIHPKVIAVNSSARLKVMLEATKPHERKGDNKYRELDRLYATVLEAAFNEDLDADEKGHIQHVLWTTVCAREPIPVATISLLVDLSESQVWSALQSLRSVVHVPENNGPVSVLHASFPEYMFDQSRSGELYCHESHSNEILTHRCLEIMKTELRFNICNLTNSYLTDDCIEDLKLQARQSISPALSYACRYWSDHLLLSPAMDQTRAMVLDFLLERLLFWMEVLGLSQCIGTGTLIMSQVQVWLKQTKDTQDNMPRMIAEARNFITWFATHPCSQSTPHIYISALPLCAKSSWVYQHYSKLMRGLPIIKTNIKDNAALATWSTDNPVITIDISPDGERIASGNIDGMIRIYSMQTGATIAELQSAGSNKLVNSVSFSPDGVQLASCLHDHTIVIWDTHINNIVSGPLHGHEGAVRSAKFSPDGKRLVSGSDDKTVIVWDICTGAILLGPLQGHISPFVSTVFSPDGCLIASAASQDDTTIRLWNSRTGEVVRLIEGHESGITSIAFSPNGKYLATGSNDNTVRVWHVSTGVPAISPLEGHKDQVLGVAFSSEGNYIVSGGGGRDRRIIVWDVRTGSVVAGPFYGHKDWIAQVVFTPDSTRIVSCSMDCTIRIWDSLPRNIVGEQSDMHTPCKGPVAFSADRSRFASSSLTGSLHVWGLHAGAVISLPFLDQNESIPIDSIALSPTGDYVAIGASDFIIRAWNALAGTIVSQSLQEHTGSITCMTFSPNSALLCSGSNDTTIVIWDFKSGSIIDQPYAGHTDSVRSVAFSPHCTHLASGAADYTVRVWDLSNGTPILTLTGHEGSIESVDFSPDGRHIVSGSIDGSIQIWDAHSGDGIKTFFPSEKLSALDSSGSSLGSYPEVTIPVTWVSYSPDGARIVAGTFYDIYILDVETTKITSKMSARSHRGIDWVGFSSDGADIVSVSRPRSPFEPCTSIRVWRTGVQDTPLASSRAAGGFYDVYDGRILSDKGLVIWAPHDLILLLEAQSESHHCVLDFSPDGIINIGYNIPCIGERWAECYIHDDFIG